MSRYRVRFKGMLDKNERTRLDEADDALTKVRAALDPDTGNFSNREVESA